MKIVKSNSYMGKQLLVRAKHNEGRLLRDVYSSWSNAKQAAWTWCRNRCTEENGEQFAIISHNTFGFSVSWLVDGGRRIETPNHSYLIIFEN